MLDSAVVEPFFVVTLKVVDDPPTLEPIVEAPVEDPVTEDPAADDCCVAPLTFADARRLKLLLDWLAGVAIAIYT